jgi:MFS family permease
MSISTNLGFVLGPAIAGILGASALGEVLPVAAALIISLIATFIIAFKLPESNPCALSKHPSASNIGKVYGQEMKGCYESREESKATLSSILQLKGMKSILAIYVFVMLAFNVFYVAFPIFAVNSLMWNVTQTGTFFTFLSLFMVVVQGPVLKWTSRKFSESTLILVGSSILIFSFLLFISNNMLVLYTAALLMALGNGLMWPSTMSLLSALAGKKHQGAVQGYASSAGAIASIIGLIVGGMLYSELNSLVFIIAASLTLVTTLLSIGIVRSQELLWGNGLE